MAAPKRLTSVEEPRTERSRVIRLDGSPLIRVGAKPGLMQYLREVWAFRHFIIYDSHSRVSSSNTNDSLGRLWMVMNPILNGFAYFLVFGLLLQTSRGVENFIGYLVIGVFMFRYTTTSINSSARSISGNQSVVQAFNFPRACLPLAASVRELFSNIPTFVIMFLLVLVLGDVMPGDDPIRVSWMWLVFFPVLALSFMLNIGLGLLLARAVSAYEDVKHLIAFGTRIWFYTSAVFFATNRFEGTPLEDEILAIMHVNPMYCVLDIVRQAWLYDTFADPARWIVLGSWAVVLLIIGTIVFWQGEEKYGREK